MSASVKRAAEILKQVKYITIASVDDQGQPWNSPVYSAFDKDLNFYWGSDKNSQHSTNIHHNPKIFLVIYDSSAAEGTGEGVYVEAEAAQIQGEKATMKAVAILDARVGKTKKRSYERYSGDNPLRGYKAVAKRVWMNDDEISASGEWVRDLRKELSIDELKAEL